MEVTVRHNPAESRFEAMVGDQLAVADYVREPGKLVFTHTYVPPASRGRGVAEQLVRAGLAWARTEGLRIEPRCSYVAIFVSRHAEYQDLLVT